MHLEIQNPGFRLLWLIVLPADTNVFIQPLPSSTVTYNRNNCPGQYPDILNISSEGDTTGSLGDLQHSVTHTVKKFPYQSHFFRAQYIQCADKIWQQATTPIFSSIPQDFTTVQPAGSSPCPSLCNSSQDTGDL